MMQKAREIILQYDSSSDEEDETDAIAAADYASMLVASDTVTPKKWDSELFLEVNFFLSSLKGLNPKTSM